MSKIKKAMKVAMLSLFMGLLTVAPTFADAVCSKYPNVSTTKDDTFSVTCPGMRVAGEPDEAGNPTYTYTSLYAKTAGDCAQASIYASDPQSCNDDKDLNGLVRTIITTIIFAVGMGAVVMIILGGVSYATSQGDPQKVKKAKDTILYGIIGLVVALLAFAIVNFVLSSIQG